MTTIPHSDERAPSRLAEFLDYAARVHARTRRLVTLIPSSALEWTPREGWFTCGDLVRHIAGIERWLYAEVAAGRPNRYPGHGRALADGADAVLAYYDRLHEESVAIFTALPDQSLATRVTMPAGAPITLWKWLRALLEHEVHHRGQLYLLLALRGVPTPPIYGLTSEQVQRHAESEVLNASGGT